MAILCMRRWIIYLQTNGEEEKANWQKIKDVMEEKGTTDNMFYKRACAIVAGQPDPKVEPRQQ